ncbi:MAG: ribosome recycling factor [Phycisphaerae bacterium]
MPLDDILLSAEEEMSNAGDFLKNELRSIRTGRASTALVEHIKVNYFGAMTDMRQLAQLSTPEANLIVIKPFDPTSIKEIVHAIQASELGITPQSDGRIIRLVIPSLSGERRKQLSHQVRQLGEHAKLVVRNARRDANKTIDTEEKEGTLPEDDAEKGKEQVQNLTKEYEKKIDETLAAKVKEIEEV